MGSTRTYTRDGRKKTENKCYFCCYPYFANSNKNVLGMGDTRRVFGYKFNQLAATLAVFYSGFPFWMAISCKYFQTIKNFSGRNGCFGFYGYIICLFL